MLVQALNDTQKKELSYLAYNFLEALYDRNDIRTVATYSNFIGYCEGLLGVSLHSRYPTINATLISYPLLSQWIIGLVKSIKSSDKGQIDSCAKVIVQTMKGNFYV